MRSDMFHVIVERPRTGGDRARKGRQVDLENLPRQEGMRRRHVLGGDRKSLNENLAPLRRYLDRQVGRPWDKVYSEICAHLRAGNVVQQHVRDHLSDYVAVKPRRIGHRLVTTAGRWEWLPGLWHQRFYVDPQNGLLRRTDSLPEMRKLLARRRPDAPPTRIAIDAARELRQIAGIWYEIALRPLPDPHYRADGEATMAPPRCAGKRQDAAAEMQKRHLVTPPVRDAVSGKLVACGPPVDTYRDWAAYRRAHPDRRYALGKRTLCSAELKRQGLRNADIIAKAVRKEMQAQQG